MRKYQVSTYMLCLQIIILPEQHLSVIYGRKQAIFDLIIKGIDLSYYEVEVAHYSQIVIANANVIPRSMGIFLFVC